MEFDGDHDHGCQGDNHDFDRRQCDFMMCSFKVEIKRYLQQQLSKGFHIRYYLLLIQSCKAEFRGDFDWSLEYTNTFEWKTLEE